jgi:hypothetical protein
LGQNKSVTDGFPKDVEPMYLQSMGTYHIEVQGQVDENTFNASGPLRITVIRTEPAATLFAICADQAGLIGLLRYLHQRGYVIDSVCRIVHRRVRP